ncbi:Sensor kinase CusS [Aquisphaera giovannonii]|uniref:histidine kinase n=1 Tax=Aquisphaera giovannonii TaxID=406548 RepID=A0A5B9W6G8_9BACT|nr:ATP-binding protein [Aquisphaera giovannonii]QEH36203.1 Sensor kinase CusS [Aquisphaera giovannonii]
MPFASIRARLTAWYGVVQMVTLVGLGVAVYVLMARSLLGRVDATLDFEIEEAADRLRSGRPEVFPADLPAAFHETYLMCVRGPGGDVVERSPSPVAAGFPDPPPDEGGGATSHATADLGAGGPFRVASRAVGDGESSRTIQVATSLAAYEREVADLRGVLWTILPAGLLAATLGGYALAGRSLAPVQRITESARRISAANLGERVRPSDGRDELGRLGATLNDMLDRIDRAFVATRRFTGDAAHELKTPVASIRAEAEVALISRRPADEYEATLRSIVEEADRLARLSERLLLLSREDLGAFAELPRQPVRLDELVRATAADAAELARRAGVELRVEALPASFVEADPVLLRQVFENLIENAVKYTPSSGAVTVRGRAQGDGAVVEVIDTGIGIPAEALPRIFDRFYRVDPSRSRRTGGTGLGLSIARALAERHGGSIEADSRPGAGSTFRVVLPALRTGGPA